MRVRVHHGISLLTQSLSGFFYLITSYEFAQPVDICFERNDVKTWNIQKGIRKKNSFLLESGILETGNAHDKMTQLLIENFLRFDLSNLDYKCVFTDTLNFPSLILEYDYRQRRRLTDVLRAAHGNRIISLDDAKEQIELFDKWFAINIWNRFPGVEKFGL